MTKRNFTLLIILIVIILLIIFGFLYFRKGNPIPGITTAGTNFLAKFNPFGSNNKNNPPSNGGGSGGDNQTGDEITVKLRKVSTMPIAGYGIYSKERLKDVPVPPAEAVSAAATDTTDSTTKTTVTKPTAPATEFMTAVRYVERATGNIDQTFADKIEEKKFTTTTVPKVYESYFGSKATAVAMRYLKVDGDTIQTFLGNLPKEVFGGDTSDTEVNGSFLPDGVTDMSVSPDSQKIFYLFNLNDTAIGTVLNFSDSKKTQVFTSPFTEWLSYWPNANTITLTTKPASTVPGFMYALNMTTRSVSEVLGGINGLTTLTSPDGKMILYGDNNGLLYIYHLDKRTSDLVGVKTLPEKCTWGSASDVLYCSVPRSLLGNSFPDTWYQGEVSFTDQIWKINLIDNTTNMLVDPLAVPGGEEFDGTKLSLDTSEDYLFFINKKDSFLWELELATPVATSSDPSQGSTTTSSTPKTTTTKPTTSTPPTSASASSSTTTSTTTVTPPAPITHNINIQNFSFSPASLTINKGDTVVWTNNDSMSHNITGDSSSTSSGTLPTGATFSFTFNSSGSFTYHCSFHPSMKGTVVVK